MTVWKKENGVWVEEQTFKNAENPTYNEEAKEVIDKDILNLQEKLVSSGTAPTDYVLRFFVPKEYNDGYKVNPSVVADMIYGLVNQAGGATVFNGKGYWADGDLLYQDNNIVIDILLPQTPAERAIAIGEYVSSVIGKAFKQLSVLFMIYPVMSEFISSDQYDEKIRMSKDELKSMDGQ